MIEVGAEMGGTCGQGPGLRQGVVLNTGYAGGFPDFFFFNFWCPGLTPRELTGLRWGCETYFLKFLGWFQLAARMKNHWHGDLKTVRETEEWMVKNMDPRIRQSSFESHFCHWLAVWSKVHYLSKMGTVIYLLCRVICKINKLIHTTVLESMY